jgi:hypothetical protein
MSLILDGTNGLSDVDGSASTPAIRGTDTNTGIFFPAADTIAFAEGGAEAMRIDSSGRLGIGTTSPTVNLEIGSDTSTVRALAVRYSSVPVYLSNSYDGTVGLSTLSANNYNTSNGSSSWSSFSNTSFGSSAVQLAVSTGGADIRFLTASASNTNPSERMRIDSDGRLLVNTTSTLSNGVVQIKGVSNARACMTLGVATNGNAAIDFLNASNVFAGSIVVNASSVAYNTSSDYRLKENIAPMTGALATVQALKPVTYTWKADGSDGQGFIAHELAEVVPDAVTGEKDAVNEDGSIKPQGIDTSFLVATLTAAIQELKAELDGVKAELATLKA